MKKAFGMILGSVLAVFFASLIIFFANRTDISAISAEQFKITVGKQIPYYDINICAATNNVWGGGAADALTVEQWVDKWGQAAFDAGKKGGVPYDIILAVAAHESTWGGRTL